MWNALRHTSLPVGIDLGRTGARLVQLEADADTVRAISAHQVTFDAELDIEPGVTPGPVEVGPQLRAALESGGFRGRRVAVCVSRELVTIKTLRLPPMPAEDLILAAEAEFRQANGLGASEWTVRPVAGGEVRQGGDVRHELTAFAVRNRDLDQLTEQWHEAGFEPAILDVESAAIYRTISRFVRRRDDQNEVNVLLDISQRRTLVVIGRGREMCFTKQIDTGDGVLTDAVARKLSLTTEEALILRQRQSQTLGDSASGASDSVRHAVVDAIRPLAEHIGREVSACLRYFSVNFRGTRPSRVRVSGGAALDAQLVAQLSAALLVPAEVTRVWNNVATDAFMVDDAPRWTTALGLALHATRGPFADRSGATREMQSNAVIEAAVQAVSAGAGREEAHA
jgi:type IV pilus assembly protein PilM